MGDWDFNEFYVTVHVYYNEEIVTGKRGGVKQVPPWLQE